MKMTDLLQFKIEMPNLLQHWDALAVTLYAIGIYGICVAVYRLYLSPLAKFPGPSLAALTILFEGYYEVVQNFEYVWRIKRMHEKYGPIVRITPDELHIDDPDFYDTLYTFKGRWSKDPFTALSLSTGSILGTLDHDLHRLRRAAIQPFFAKSKIYALEPVIQTLVEKLCTRMQEYQEREQPVPLREAYQCFAADVVTEYCFAENGGLLDYPDFAVQDWANLQQGFRTGFRIKYLPWLLPIIRLTPKWMLGLIFPAARNFGVWNQYAIDPVKRMEASAENDPYENLGHRTIFQEIVNNTSLPPKEKSTQRLVQEAGGMITGGGESTTQVLTSTTFFLAANPDKLQRLRKELKSVTPDTATGSLSLRQLEKLPYLTAVVKEGLRLRIGKLARQQRVPVDCPLFYKKWKIPAGTMISMTPIYLHINPEVFPNPHAFLPERWLDLKDKQRQHLEHNLVPFIRGSRSCIGMNLAYAELFMTIAAVVSRFNLELYETDEWDVEIAIDSRHRSPRAGSNGVRVLLKKLD